MAGRGWHPARAVLPPSAIHLRLRMDPPVKPEDDEGKKPENDKGEEWRVKPEDDERKKLGGDEGAEYDKGGGR